MATFVDQEEDVSVRLPAICKVAAEVAVTVPVVERFAFTLGVPVTSNAEKVAVLATRFPLRLVVPAEFVTATSEEPSLKV